MKIRLKNVIARNILVCHCLCHVFIIHIYILNMTSNISPSSNKNKDLMNRLIILEKFIELKSNECAYYRTKVHLMQMNSFNSSITNKNNKRSSSEDISPSSITSQSIDKKHRTNSIPLSSQRKSSLKKVRKIKSIKENVEIFIVLEFKCSSSK